MATNYADKRLAAALKNHLLTVDVMPPNAEMSKLAGELAQVCLSELNAAGLEADTIEELFEPQTLAAKVGGRD